MALQQDMTLANALARRNSHLWQQSGQERQIEAQEDAQEKATKAQQEGQAAQQMQDDVQRMTGVGLQQQNLAQALEAKRMSQAFEESQGAKERADALKRSLATAEMNTRPENARVAESARAALVKEALEQKRLADLDAHYKRMDNRPPAGRGGGSHQSPQERAALSYAEKLQAKASSSNAKAMDMEDKKFWSAETMASTRAQAKRDQEAADRAWASAGVRRPGAVGTSTATSGSSDTDEALQKALTL